MILSEVKRVDSDSIPKQTRDLYTQAIVIALVGNILLASAKTLAAYWSGSSAITADALNSAGDVIYSILMTVGLLLSLKPADVGHPHGHRRIEALVSIFIGLGMSVAGLAAIRSGITRLLEGPAAITHISAYLAPILVLIIKGAMYWRVSRLGTRANSPALLASARDNLNDVVATGVALVSIILSRFASISDPIGALLVSVWIFRGVYLVIREAVNNVTGGAGSPELTQRIIDTAVSVPGVQDVHQVIVEHVGPEVRADLHINMDGAMPLVQVHAISDRVREAIEGLEGVEHAFIHVEPVDEHSANLPVQEPMR